MQPRNTNISFWNWTKVCTYNKNVWYGHTLIKSMEAEIVGSEETLIGGDVNPQLVGSVRNVRQ